MKVDFLKYNNSWYNPGAGKVKQILWYFCNLLFVKNHYQPVSMLKVIILRIFGAKIGKGVNIKPGVNIKYPWRLTIGDYCWIGENVWIDNLAEITIGNNVCVSQGAMLLCGNHNYKISTFDLQIGMIMLEDGVWIGAQAVVCPNVCAKSHAILSVGSVASNDLEPYGIYRGNPAVKVRERVIE